ncbi:MAG: hypothetical protein IJT36_03425 [Alphaproteobacteria bacterium]|nr:hypothetical protein [Alphaproteobacteria bacterium]
MNKNDKEKYIIVGIVSNKSTTYPQGHMAFLGKHGKNVYFTSHITDACICEFDSKNALSSFYNDNRENINVEANFWCINFLYIGHKKMQLDYFFAVKKEAIL